MRASIKDLHSATLYIYTFIHCYISHVHLYNHAFGGKRNQKESSKRVALIFVKLYFPWPPKYSATHTGTCWKTLTCTHNSIMLGGASHVRCTVHTLCSPLCNNNSKKPLKHQIKISNFPRPVATIQNCLRPADFVFLDSGSIRTKWTLRHRYSTTTTVCGHGFRLCVR